MSGNSLKYILLLCFAWSQLTMSAQETRRIDGQRYQVHVVEKGHTLFAISKKYSIDIDQIIEHNPEAKTGLSIGQEVLIPVKEIDRKAARDNPPEIDGEFLEHVVEKKETLFSISKKYGVDINDILEYNPGADEDLQPGQRLRIAVADFPVDDPESLVPAQQDSLMHHVVDSAQTLYRIARMYNVSIDSLRQVNEGLIDDVQRGETIRIPLYTEEYLSTMVDTTSVESVPPKLSGPRRTYRVALMLPFSTEMQDSLEAKSDPTKQLELYTLTRISVEMYRGVLLAADSLVKQGLDVELSVYDVTDDLLELDDLLKKREFKDMHLIIGPLHRESYEMVSKFAEPHGIRVVAPVPNQKLKPQYRGSCIVHSTALQQMGFLGRYVSRMHFTDNVVVVDSDKFKDYDYVRTFLDNYESPYGSEDTVRTAKLDKYGIKSIEQQLTRDRKNIVVVPSSDLGFVSDFMNRMSNINDDYDVQIMGMEKWLDYHNIDIEYKNQFKLTVPSATYLNFDLPKTKSFIRKYSDEYDQEPGSDGYAFLGFDVAYFFLEGLMEYGLDFPRYYPELKHEGIHLGFNFEEKYNGTFNRHIYLLQYEDFHLKKLN